MRNKLLHDILIFSLLIILVIILINLFDKCFGSRDERPWESSGATVEWLYKPRS